MEEIQYRNVIGADFSENTIIFEMKDDFTICAGEFAIIKLDTLKQKMDLEEFIKNQKK